MDAGRAGKVVAQSLSNTDRTDVGLDRLTAACLGPQWSDYLSGRISRCNNWKNAQCQVRFHRAVFLKFYLLTAREAIKGIDRNKRVRS